jgi:hypothetical protein
MDVLVNQTGQPLAFIHNNIILLSENMKVSGILLGNCVFGLSGAVVGKIFDRTLYTVSGEIVAKRKAWEGGGTLSSQVLIQAAWDIIQSLKDHQCQWITPTETWERTPMEQILQ